MSTRTIHWTEDTKTMMIRTDIPNFFIEFGNQMVYRVKNNTGQTMQASTVVYFNGSDIFPTIELADYLSYLTSEGTLGLCAHEIPDGTEGYIIVSGILRNVDLSNFSDGDDVYLFSNGLITNERPVAPLPEVYLGTVIKSGLSGILNVNIELGFELEELHNVKINSLQNGDVLNWDSDNQVWQNSSLSSLIGTSSQVAEYIHFTSSIFDVEAEFISLDAGTGSVQILGNSDIDIAALGGELLFMGNSGLVTTTNELGFVYSSDYSQSFVTHSLVSKKYVDDLVKSYNMVNAEVEESSTGLTLSNTDYVVTFTSDEPGAGMKNLILLPEPQAGKVMILQRTSGTASLIIQSVGDANINGQSTYSFPEELWSQRTFISGPNEWFVNP